MKRVTLGPYYDAITCRELIKLMVSNRVLFFKYMLILFNLSGSVHSLFKAVSKIGYSSVSGCLVKLTHSGPFAPRAPPGLLALYPPRLWAVGTL